MLINGVSKKDGKIRIVLGGEVETYVIPEGHNQNHSCGCCLVHLGEATDLGEAGLVAEGSDGALTPLIGKLVTLNTGPGRVGVLDLLAVLDEELDDLSGSPLGNNTVFPPGVSNDCEDTSFA